MNQLHVDEGKCSRGAALLLMKVREIAIHEIHDTPFTDDDINVITPKPRCRTVSLDIGTGTQMPVISKSSSSNSFCRNDLDAAIVEADDDSDSIVLHPVFPCTSSKKLVGTSVRTSTAKGVLRKKFSWKSYPELEAFLVENRLQYMEYSSQLNYTAEQKRYNNTLTQGLLDLAAVEGYIFEGFTFSAIRDRIRCYYKSCVQANKKKKKRRKHTK
ncbi:hypothetical protein FisN_15Lh214 [Fistulifera solaris]|uniref:Uncharacterized protein n=1 Tax=Fistulifera solaris TaxID=1519565 RepID=A0A1Z5JDL7_FISSO|nr:hypothetical protein FisN_15Lh214 [Fistulifera solaris]|eukprot:GAX12094.1 hypothetical protein FisN_15Lh214 [Fistulifera solaris]